MHREHKKGTIIGIFFKIAPQNWPRHNVILHMIILASSPTYKYSSRL